MVSQRAGDDGIGLLSAGNTKDVKEKKKKKTLLITTDIKQCEEAVRICFTTLKQTRSKLRTGHLEPPC